MFACCLDACVCVCLPVRVFGCVFGGSNALECTLQAVRKRMQAHLCAIKLDPDEKDHAEVAGEQMTCAVVLNGPVDAPPAQRRQ